MEKAICPSGQSDHGFVRFPRASLESPPCLGGFSSFNFWLFFFSLVLFDLIVKPYWGIKKSFRRLLFINFSTKDIQR